MKNLVKGTLIAVVAYLFIGVLLSGFWTYKLHSELNQIRADVEQPFVETDDPFMDILELLTRATKEILLVKEDEIRAQMPMNFIEQIFVWPVVLYKGEHL